MWNENYPKMKNWRYTMTIQKARADVFRQITHYLKINPACYLRLCDELDGDFYAVTYISHGKNHCILASCNNITNPAALVEIITF